MSAASNLNIAVHHVTRVEGHGDITAVVENGAVKEVRFDVVEAPRYFEAMLLDKKITQCYEITSRICGICSISHTLVSLRAIEDILQVSVSEQTRIIRSLAMCAELLTSHILHICFLAVPDFLNVPSVIPLIEQDPELVLKALRLKRIANILADTICGRHTHPLTLVIGGLTYVPPKEKLNDIKTILMSEMLPGLSALANVLSGLKLPDFERDTEYLCLDNFYREPAFGRTIKSSDGDITPSNQYRSKITEYVLPTSTAKFAKANRPSYMVGALARFNNLYPDLCPEAKETAAQLNLKPPCRNSFAITPAQLVECVHFTIKSIEYIDQLLGMDLKDEELPKPTMWKLLGELWFMSILPMRAVW